MCKCNVCGNETAKGRQTCKGCHALKQVVKKKDKVSNTVFDKANKHLEKNPDLINISWASFFKR